MIEFKILTYNDLALCENLFCGNTEYVSPPSKLSLENYYFDNSCSLFSVFGAIDDENIIALVFVHFSNLDRSWFVRYVMNNSNANMDIIAGLFNYIISYAESNFYYRWFALYTRPYKLFEKILHTRVELFKRYISVTEETLEARERSSSRRYWEDFQECTLSEQNSVIRMYVLADKYRKFR